jgi:glutamate formiminotransferase
MINPDIVPLYRIIEMVRSEARRYGLSVIGTDICGMISKNALMDCCEYYMQLENFDRKAQIFEEQL